MAQNPISTPLPADLPVNWTEGQTVAPNGPDVGLSQQHGYNYQSQQINSAQSAINTIGSAFSNLYGNTDIVPVVNGGTGGETADEARANLGAASNENLLINWDFRNPVNQRGLSEYVGITYTVDMWQLNANRGKLNVNDGYITLTNTAESGAEYLRQGFEKNFEAGDVLTLSAEIRGNGSGQLFLGNSTDGANIGGYTEYTATSDWQVITFTKTLESTLPKWWVIQVTGQNAYIDIRRVKLELGSVSTLQNDPPQDYAEELRKCQRYQFMTNASSRWARASKITDSVIYFDVACPATMRANPTITQNNTLRVTTFDVASTAQTGFTFACADQQGAIRIAASKASHGLTDATLEMVSVLFDANL